MPGSGQGTQQHPTRSAAITSKVSTSSYSSAQQKFQCERGNDSASSLTNAPSPVRHCPGKDRPSHGQKRSTSRLALSVQTASSTPRHRIKESPPGALKTKHSAIVSDLQFIIRIIGAAGTGKSTFIKAASEVEDHHAFTETVTFAVGRRLCKVTFEEILLKNASKADTTTFSSSPALEKDRSQTYDGNVLIYDVMSDSSLLGVPEMLRDLRARDAQAVVLVATKCDNPPAVRQIDTNDIAIRARRILKDIKIFESVLFSTEPAQLAVRELLLSIIANHDLAASRRTRPRSDSAALALAMQCIKPEHDDNLASVSDPELPEDEDANGEGMARDLDSQQMQETVHGVPQRIVDSSQSSSQSDLKPTSQRGFVARPRLQSTQRSFLILDDLSESETEMTSDTRSSVRSETTAVPYGNAMTLHELVEALLRPMPTQEEDRFVYTFFAFYRLFASPSALLDMIIRHAGSVSESEVVPWEHETIVNRDMAVIESWIKQYPGDFAGDETKQRLTKFLLSVSPDSIVGELMPDPTDSGYFSANHSIDESNRAATARQIMIALSSVRADEDTGWACSDMHESLQGKLNEDANQTLSSAYESRSSTEMQDLQKAARSNFKYDNMLIFGGQFTVTLNAMGRDDEETGLLRPLWSTINVAECARRQVSLLLPTNRRPLNKDYWRLVASQPEEVIAKELTRIDWILFSSIRPRSLIKHVRGLSSRETEHVGKVNDHFNHLGYWVTNLILYRDKPKHRAQMLEKMMRIAKKLRKINNYNTLAAIIAAIRGPAISRLSMTRDLVDAGVQKKFASLEILMSTARSHWAYRFALENTKQTQHPRIPFLPLHRRDLIVAESAGQTFATGDASSTEPSKQESAALRSQQASTTDDTRTRGRKINWSKFAVMGETLAILRDAQSCPYTGFVPNDTVQAIVLDPVLCKDDDQLWERSAALEPPSGSGPQEGQRAQVRRKIQVSIDKFKQHTREA